jgi:hypothetical protein
MKHWLQNTEATLFYVAVGVIAIAYAVSRLSH